MQDTLLTEYRCSQLRRQLPRPRNCNYRVCAHCSRVVSLMLNTETSPDFRVLGSLAGDATLQMKADYGVNFAKWDYSMRYPIPDGEDDKPDKGGVFFLLTSIASCPVTLPGHLNETILHIK
jgi:hypothetical protein